MANITIFLLYEMGREDSRKKYGKIQLNQL